MAREEVGMIVSQENVFKFSVPIVNQFSICLNIKDRIYKKSLFFRLNIVGEDGEF